MTIIGAERMTSDITDHWATPVDNARPYGDWWVSWNPGVLHTYNQATTAMIIAETVARMQAQGYTLSTIRAHRSWPHVEAWAHELGLTGPDVLARTSDAVTPHASPTTQRATQEGNRQ